MKFYCETFHEERDTGNCVLCPIIIRYVKTSSAGWRNPRRRKAYT